MFNDLYLPSIPTNILLLLQLTKIGHLFHLNATNHSHKDQLDMKDTNFEIFSQV